MTLICFAESAPLEDLLGISENQCNQSNQCSYSQTQQWYADEADLTDDTDLLCWTRHQIQNIPYICQPQQPPRHCDFLTGNQ
jgi:hypothetical protein